MKIVKPNVEHSRGSTEFYIQNFKQIGQGVHELWSNIKKTDKQTKNRDYYFIFV